MIKISLDKKQFFFFLFFFFLFSSVNGTSMGNCGKIYNSGDYFLVNGIINYTTTNTEPACIGIRGEDIIFDCKGHKISGIKQDFGPADYDCGINILGENITIKNCILSQWAIGISGRGTEIKMVNNTILASYDAIRVYNGEKGKIINNTIKTSSIGIFIDNVSNTEISGNTMGLCAIWNSLNVSVTKNNISHSKWGVFIYNVTNVSIGYNEISKCEQGIEVQESIENIISNNEIYENNFGIHFWDAANHNIVKGNKIIFNDIGIHISNYRLPDEWPKGKGTTGNMIINNTIINNSKYGIFSTKSSAYIVCNNVCGNNISDFEINDSSVLYKNFCDKMMESVCENKTILNESYVNVIEDYFPFLSNAGAVNNNKTEIHDSGEYFLAEDIKNFIYVEGENTTINCNGHKIVSPHYDGKILINNSKNIIVKNCILENNGLEGYGIFVTNSKSWVIKNCTLKGFCTNDGSTIFVDNSLNVSIVNNAFDNCWTPIWTLNSEASISENFIKGANQAIIISSNSAISKNKIIESFNGILIDGSNNTIENNVISAYGGEGILVWSFGNIVKGNKIESCGIRVGDVCGLHNRINEIKKNISINNHITITDNPIIITNNIISSINLSRDTVGIHIGCLPYNEFGILKISNNKIYAKTGIFLDKVNSTYSNVKIFTNIFYNCSVNISNPANIIIEHENNNIMIKVCEIVCCNYIPTPFWFLYRYFCNIFFYSDISCAITR